MWNLQSTPRETEAHIAAFNVEMDRLRDEAINKLLQESILPTVTKSSEPGAGTLSAVVKGIGTLRNSSAYADGLQPGAESDSSSITVAPAPPSKRKNTKQVAEVESASEADSEHGANPPKRKRTAHTQAVKKPDLPPFKASLKSRAEDGTIKVTGSTADLDNAALAKIKKCLERANHPNAPEAEKKAAFSRASQWMARFNVTQAEVLAHEPPDVQRQYAGQSVVSITRTDENPDKAVRHFAYVDILLSSMNTYFDCKSYSTDYKSSLELTFYGIAENTVAAAMAFETAYNLISEWARKYKGVASKNSYSIGASEELRSMAKRAKKAEAKKAKKAERDALAAKVQQEAAERQAELDRLAPLPQSPVEIASEPDEHGDSHNLTNRRSWHGRGDADDPISLDTDEESAEEDNLRDSFTFVKLEGDGSDDECIEADFTADDEGCTNDLGDVDEEIEKLIKREPQSAGSSPPPQPLLNSSDRTRTTSPALKQEPQTNEDDNVQKNANNQSGSEPAPNSIWASHMQLVTFRETATKIAEDYMKEQGVKLRKGRKRSHAVRDWDAYDRGVEDGRKIDVHRKTIKE